MTIDRLADLREIRAGLIDRMADARSDQNYAIMGRLLVDVVNEIEQLENGVKSATVKTGLSEFERKLNARTGATGTGRTANGTR